MPKEKKYPSSAEYARRAGRVKIVVEVTVEERDALRDAAYAEKNS